LQARYFFDSFAPCSIGYPGTLKHNYNGIFARPLEVYEGTQEMVARTIDHCVAAYWCADSIWR